MSALLGIESPLHHFGVTGLAWLNKRSLGCRAERFGTLPHKTRQNRGTSPTSDQPTPPVHKEGMVAEHREMVL